MPKKEDLPHLLRLLDDDSKVVRKSITEALAEFGPELEDELAELPISISPQDVELINKLLKTKDIEINLSRVVSSTDEPTEEPIFEIGQLVHHKRYGYRGVIVEFDVNCQADESWYRSNLTQPDREQPWYYVLVDNAYEVTYAAQTSLEPDNSGLPITNPLISKYFEEFEEGRYIRNNRPWPSK